jgi:hypothetical protein
MSGFKFVFGGFVGAALCLTLASPTLAANGMVSGSPDAAFWAGGAFKNHVEAGYAGGIWAPAGTLDSQGFLVKAQYLYVSYDFPSTLAATGTAIGQLNRANAQIGYQFVNSGIAASLFLGPDYQDFSTTPAAAGDAALRDKLGLIVSGRMATAGMPQYPVSLEGDYSTANDTYYTKAKAGMRFGQFAVGPAIGILGNKAFDEARFGAYASLDVWPGKTVEIGAGYSDELRSSTSSPGGSRSGVYGEVTLILLHY